MLHCRIFWTRVLPLLSTVLLGSASYLFYPSYLAWKLEESWKRKDLDTVSSLFIDGTTFRLLDSEHVAWGSFDFDYERNGTRQYGTHRNSTPRDGWITDDQLESLRLKPTDLPLHKMVSHFILGRREYVILLYGSTTNGVPIYINHWGMRTYMVKGDIRLW